VVGAAGHGQIAVAEGRAAGGADGVGVEVGAAGVLEDDGLGAGLQWRSPHSLRAKRHGVDHSPGARRALAWVAQEAGLRQAVLQVMHAYHAEELAAPFYFPSQHALPATVVGRAGEPAPQELAASMGDHAEFEQAYRSQAEEFLKGLLGELEESLGGVRVQPTVVADQHPAEALVDLSADADPRC
jgi:hypothetical protein